VRRDVKRLLPDSASSRVSKRKKFVRTMRVIALAAAWAPLAAARHGCPQYNFAGVNPTGTGSLSLDWLDAWAGAGSCARLLAVPTMTCAMFGPGGPQEGQCDHTCQFCIPVETLTPELPLCANYSPYGGQLSRDYYDSWQAGSCAAVLANDKKSCDTTFSPTGSLPNFCDRTCGYCKGAQPALRRPD